MKLKTVARLTLAAMLAAAPLMTGCVGESGPRGFDGEDGEAGEAGEQGEQGEQGSAGKDGVPGAKYFLLSAELPATLKVEVTGAKMVDGKPVVDFKLIDAAGRAGVGLTLGSTYSPSFGVAKLIPGTNGGADTWASYINREATGTVSGKVSQGTAESNGTLVDHENGTYTYTFATDLSTVKYPHDTTKLVGYEPALTHRVAVQVGNATVPISNSTFDFVPAGGTPTVSRNVAATESCLECHDKGTFGFHSSGARVEVKYCVVCHNPGSIDPDTGNSVDMAQMTHKIHAAAKLAKDAADEGKVFKPYTIIGNKGSIHDYSHVGYPQAVNNCRKCHNGDDETTPQGNNWAERPSREACGSCHSYKIDWSKPHPAGTQVRTTDAACSLCHDAAGIAEVHAGENNTPNATEVKAGLSNFTYEILKVEVANNTQPKVTFRVTRDGKAINYLAAAPNAALADLSSSPSFLIAYAMPQPGEPAPIDWNMAGRKAAQPATVSLADLLPGAASPKGTLTAGADGSFVATIKDPTATTIDKSIEFPAGSTLRAVALQGYYQQGTAKVGRHTVAAIGYVASEKRREIVDDEKCASCHEWFEGHGGNRVKTTMVCATCHNPNLSTSGRGAALANMTAAEQAKAIADGMPTWDHDNDPATPAVLDLTKFPEASNNFKDMIHSIHASHVRENDFRFARDRGTSGVFYYNFGHVTFPATASNCESCHKAGTYYGAPAKALPTTEVTDNGTTPVTAASVAASRTSVPNLTDTVSTANAAACGNCHDSALATAHIEQNGGMLASTRSAVVNAMPLETCSLCHGAGKTADVKVMHSKTAAAH